MKFIRLGMLFAFMLVATSAQAFELTRKVESFDFFVDYSGSMMQKFSKTDIYKGKKIDAAKAVLTKINKLIPELGYAASMHSFSPASTIVPYSSWDKNRMNVSIFALDSSQEIFERRTGIGDGLLKFSGEYINMISPSAILIVSDGGNNIGIDPVYEASKILGRNPQLCIHVISFAETEKDQELLNNIARLKPCSRIVSGLQLLSSDELAKQFVKEIFYNIEDTIVLHDVNFAFDSSKLDDNSKSLLNQVAQTIKNYAKPVVVEAWTDSSGDANYNKGLSEKRANAVKKYLESQGIPANMMTAVGSGESNKYSNETKEGRRLNRRTEIHFK